MYNQHPTSVPRCINRAHRATYPFIIALQDDCKQDVANDFQNIPMDSQNIPAAVFTRKSIIFYTLGWSSPHDLHAIRDECIYPPSEGKCNPHVMLVTWAALHLNNPPRKV